MTLTEAREALRQHKAAQKAEKPRRKAGRFFVRGVVNFL